MAEFCLECFKKINGPEYAKHKYVLTKELNFCEECGEIKRTVFMERKCYYLRTFRCVLFPLKLIFVLIDFIARVLFLPFFIYKRKKRKNGNKS